MALVVIREAIEVDAPAMARVHLDAALTGFADIFPPDAPAPTLEGLTEQWEGLIGDPDPRSRAFAADASAIVGTAVARADPADPGRGHLRSLYVAPAWWGRGLGQRLHDAVVAQLRNAGFRQASLWVMEKNPARRMYEALGWHQSPDRQTIWPGIDEVRYVLDLRGAGGGGSQASPRNSG